MNQPSPVELLTAAIEHSRPILATVETHHLEAPTPCSDWDLRALLSHIAGRAVLSERAARGMAVTEFPDTNKDLLGASAVSTLQDLLDASLTSWRSATDLAGPRVTPIGKVPGFGLIAFQAQDVFVHGWDIARTIGTEPTFDLELTQVMFEMHQQSVTPGSRAAFFGPEVPVPQDAPILDRLLGFLGRQP
jgi:uncharacterized protein (TIGR03086 family)